MREAVSIYDVLREHGITVASTEKAQKLHCPVHEDRHKSAVVYPDTQEIYCFACHRTYDVVSLIQEWEGMTWWQACDFLEQRVGLVYERQTYPEDSFWRMVRNRETGKMSSRQAYDLRWAVHRTVLELAKDPDWEIFDRLELTDVSSLLRWRDDQLR